MSEIEFEEKEDGVVPVGIKLQDHPGILEAIETYILNDRDINAVDVFFKTKYGAKYYKPELRTFFGSIDERITKEDVEERRTKRELQETALMNEKNSGKEILSVQQMLLDRMYSIFFSSKKNKKTINVNDHAKQTKELCELARSYREFYQMSLEMLGMGKSPEETQEDMRNYVTAMLKESLSVFEGDADSQKKLSDFLDSQMRGVKTTKSNVVKEGSDESS